MRVVELNATDLARATDCAHARNRMELRPDGDEGYSHNRFGALRSYETALAFNEVGAQGEIALAKLIGTTAPLHVDTFRSRPDVPPNWNIKTQLSASQDMRRRYLRLRPRDFQHGYRHVLIERDVAFDGRPVFMVHGWIADDDARLVGRSLYAYSKNLFIHVGHLQPVERLCQLDEAYYVQVAERWRFDGQGNLTCR